VKSAAPADIAILLPTPKKSLAPGLEFIGLLAGLDNFFAVFPHRGFFLSVSAGLS